MFFKRINILHVILNIELWERFAFYGLQAIINTYLLKNKSLLLSEYDVIVIFSSFTALLYGVTPFGEWLGNKILGISRTMQLGLFISLIGYILIFLAQENKKIIILSLSILAIGSCIFKVNPSLILTNYCSKKNNSEIDRVFTLYYTIINVGSLLSMLLTPYLFFKYGWQISILSSILGLMISLITSFIYKNKIQKFGSKIDVLPLKITTITNCTILILLITLVFYSLINTNYIANILSSLIVTIYTFIIIKQTLQLKSKPQKEMVAILILMLESLFFFVLYNQAPTSINMLTIKNVNTKISNINFRPEQFQSLNPLFILILTPVLNYIYKKNNISVAYKFLTGIILYSISFIFLVIGIDINLLDTNTLISPLWIILCYLFQSIGELLVSALGLSMITQLAPKNLINISVNIWFLVSSISSFISGKIFNSITQQHNISQFTSLIIFKNFFTKIIILCIIVVFLISIITPYLNFIIKNKIHKLNK